MEEPKQEEGRHRIGNMGRKWERNDSEGDTRRDSHVIPLKHVCGLRPGLGGGSVN